jgi:hypothetical protein
MTRLLATVVAAVATGCTCSAPTAPPCPPQLPTGVFRYLDAHGTARSATNPAPGACLRTRNSIRAANDTGRPVELYDSPDCRGLIRTVELGGDFSGDFHSAMVVPAAQPNPGGRNDRN